MGQYLESFKDKIGKRQADQILRILNRKRNTGQIRSVDEFAQQLESLMQELTSAVLQPSLKVWMAETNQEIDSDTYNFMLDRVEDDLVAAFEEANNIDEVQISHEALIRDVILKNLRAGVAELESRVTLYEFLNKDLRGFDSAIFSTFRESKENRTERSPGQITQTLFNDPRENAIFSASQDAFVELVGERLILPLDNSTIHTISNARQIFDATTTQSEVVVNPPNLSLANMIDNTKGTYWVQALLFQQKQESVKVKLEFNLGTVKEINFIEVEPVSKFEVILESVDYIDGNNIATSLDVPEQTISGPLSLRTRKVATDRIILTFRNENYARVQFRFDPDSDKLQDQAILEPPEGIDAQFQAVSKDLRNLLGNTKIKDLLPLSEGNQNTFSGYEFLFGIDNIRVGLANHTSKGVYVSTPLSIKGAGEIGIKTVEGRPYLSSGATLFTESTYDIDTVSGLTDDSALAVGGQSNVQFLGSIEYWIIKQDFDASEALIRTSVFPVMPLGTSRIYHERLVLNEKSSSTLISNDIGQTIFFTSRDEALGVQDTNILVYRNGILMPDQTGVVSPTTGWIWENDTSLIDRTPGSGTPMRFRIRILDPLPGDIFTVTYTPRLSSTKYIPKTLPAFTTVGGLQVVDLVGDLSARAAEAQQVILDRTGENDQTLTSKIFLSIILRQNTAESSLTPSVEEYTLVGGCKDDTKFETT